MPESSSTDDPAQRASLAQALFSPASIALIGATPHPDRLTSRPQRVLRKHGFGGQIVPINPRYAEIGGDRAYGSLRSCAGSIDHAFVMVPAIGVRDAIAECCAANVRVATILTAGFAEASPEGRKREQAMVAMARDAGLRLLGPNCLGVIDVGARVALSANAVLEQEALCSGGLSVVSQSGSMLGALITRAQERGLGFSRLVSVGNECDIGVGELVHLLVDDPRTHAILLFIEAFRDAEVLAAAARRAYDAGKPVIALKLGRSRIGRAAAATHTGALASGDDVDRAFFRHHGIVCVDMFEALFETAQLLLGRRPPASRRVAVLTVSGGAAALIVDRLGMAGLDAVPPPPALVARLAARKIRITDGVVTDVVMGRADHGAYAAILAELMASDHCDAVIAVQGSEAAHAPQVVRERILAAMPAAKPLAVFIAPRAEQALAFLQQGGVAAFRTPEACADAVRAYCEWRAPAEPVEIAVTTRDRIRQSVRSGAGRTLDAQDSARMLSAIGIACAPSQVMRDAHDRVELPFPVAVKVLTRDIAHKTDVGGIVLDIPDQQALLREAELLFARVRTNAPQARVDGLLVQTMERGLGEVIVGYRRDREVGALIMVGVGGTLTELWTRHALRLAPVSVATALEMIAEVPGLAAIRGFRHRPAGDLQALAQVIHALSLLAVTESPAVLEAEINPLVVRERGAVAIDVRIELEAG